MFFTKDRIGALLLLAFCLAYAWQSQNIKLLPFQANQAFTPRTIPEVLAVLGTILSVAILVVSPSREKPEWSSSNWLLGFAFLVLMSLYGLAVRPLGFLFSTSAFLMIGFAMLGERNIFKLILVAVPLVVAFWALMNYGLSVYINPLPTFMTAFLKG